MLLIPALFFGYALAKISLSKRIAYLVLKTFDPSYGSVILSWTIIGIILSALTPSITVRLAIVIPIAMNLVEACKIPDRSKGSALITLVACDSALLPGTSWQTGSLWGVFMIGFYPPEIKSLVTFDVWFEYMIVPWTITTILFVVLFATEKYHGISTPAVAMGAFLALMLFGIITFPEISTDVN